MSQPVGRRQLLLEVGDHLLAADARQISEVREPSEATPVPGSVPGVLGLINLRGDLVIAADLPQLLGLDAAAGPERAQVVFEEGDRRVALCVDRVVGVLDNWESLDVDGEMLEALGARDVVAGVGQFEARPCFLLDVKAIFARVVDLDGDGDQRVQLESNGGVEQK